MNGIIDIHTHTFPLDQEKAILNIVAIDFARVNSVKYASVGLHPWYIYAETLEQQKDMLAKAIAASSVIAVGESGLDKLCNTDWDLQMNAFHCQAALTATLGMPFILHAVKAHNEIMEMKRKLHATNTWIVHGFRGKPELAEQYLNNGFYLSFGANFNPESLKITPLERLFFETDEFPMPIEQIYQQAASVLSLSQDTLMMQARQNAERVFFNR